VPPAPEAEAGLALSNFKSSKSILKERQTWDKVIQRLELQDMPPKDAAPLAQANRKKLVEWLKSTINDIDCGRTPNPGSVTLRRLNRAEYRNTVRDLLDIDYSPASGFPGDDVGYGFDNIGDVLTLPPLLMEKYITAAEEISQKAILAPEPGQVFETIRKPSQLSAGGAGAPSGDTFSFYANGKITIEEQFSWRGTYTLEMGLTGTPAAGQYPRMLVSVDGKKEEELKVQTADASRPKSFVVPLKITLVAAFMVALPIVLYQLWAFVAPGLYSHEKRLVMPLVISSTLLFFIGVGFSYFFVFGQVFKFIQGFAPKSITAAPDIEAYLGFVLTMFIAFGAAFEVPIVVIVLARLGLVSIEKLKAFRSYFIVTAFVVAAIITPPDVVSQLALAIPMCILYEIGIWAAQLFIKHTKAPDAEGETAA